MRVGPSGSLFLATPLKRESKDVAVLVSLGAGSHAPTISAIPPQSFDASRYSTFLRTDLQSEDGTSHRQS